MNRSHLEDIAILAQQLPRKGSAFPRTDVSAAGMLNAYLDTIIEHERRSASEEVAKHWRLVVDQRVEAAQKRARTERLHADRQRSLLGYLAMWWNKDEYQE